MRGTRPWWLGNVSVRGLGRPAGMSSWHGRRFHPPNQFVAMGSCRSVASWGSTLPPCPQLPLGERVALSGPLTRDTWLGLSSRSGPWLPGSQRPGTATQGGGASALRAPLSTTGELGRRLRRFSARRKASAAVPGGHHRHTESCKAKKKQARVIPNKPCELSCYQELPDDLAPQAQGAAEFDDTSGLKTRAPRSQGASVCESYKQTDRRRLRQFQ